MKTFAIVKNSIFCGIFFLGMLVNLGFASSSEARTGKKAFETSVIVLAPTSMSEAMMEISREYSKKHNVSIGGSFEAASELGRIIEDGDPANIFITEDDYRIKYLQRRGTLDVFSQVEIISDKLVFVAPKGSFLKKKLADRKTIEEKLKYLSKTISLVVPDVKSEASGKYIRQAFKRVGAWQEVEKRMLRANNNRNALYLMANGNSPGFAYKSDVNGIDNIEILFEVSEKFHDKVIYKAFIVGGISADGDKQKTDSFLDFLQSLAAKNIFLKYGFSE